LPLFPPEEVWTLQTLTWHSVKTRFDTRNSSDGRLTLFAEGCRRYESLQPWHAHEPPIPCTERRRFRTGAGGLDGRRLLAIFRIELAAGSWKVGERSTQNLNISDQKGTISSSLFTPKNLRL